MFTGIITQLGSCMERSTEGLVLECPKDFADQLSLGSSVSVNGVCLTVASLERKYFGVALMPETWEKTSLGSLTYGVVVNLELALGVNGRFDGHIVQGHVDSVGTIQAIRQSGNSHIFSIAAPLDLTRYMTEKGSLAMNGIALTLMSVSHDSFTLGIIPYTFEHTMLRHATVGDQVNIEVDIIAKYVMKFLKEQHYDKK